MSFWSAVSSIVGNLEKVFEKNAVKGVKHPDDGSQAHSDSREAGGDAVSTAGDAANDESERHDPAWKAVKDLSDRAVVVETKAIETAKVGWLQFVGVVTGIFAVVLTFSFRHGDERTDESRSTLAFVQHEHNEQQQLQQLQVMVGEAEFDMMTAGLLVAPSAPAPIVSTTAPAAVAAPEPELPAMPAPVAAIAEEPAQVEFTTESGATRTVSTTVGQVYRSSPPSVQHVIEAGPPPQTHELGITEDPNSCFVKKCLSSPDPHKSFTVDAVDGNGNKFGSAKVKY